MERGQPYVARGSRVVPLRFELVEKEQHEFDLEQLQGQVNHRFPEVPRGKLQEQLERVSIAEDGVRAEVALTFQIVLEE